jgi:hypothetical protein
MPLTNDNIRDAVLRYEREYDRYSKLADVVYERCLRIVDESGVRATVQRRTKKPQRPPKEAPADSEKDPG